VRVLLLHNRYRQAGGEDTVVGAERALLESRGHDVRLYEVSNDAIDGAASRLRAAGRAVYSIASRRAVAGELLRFSPDVVHVHNFFPLLSPSVYSAARAAGAAVVQTVHNFRLLCPSGTLFRDGRPCEDCLGRAVAWPGLLHGCYRGSRAATAPVVAMLATHRALRTWSRLVDRYIAPSAFVRQKLVDAGFAAERIDVKPHFVAGDPPVGDGRGGYALAVARISEEKGIRTLLAAWSRLRLEVPLKIVGDGPLRAELVAASRGLRHVEWVGRATPAEVGALMRAASMLVVPSVWYETFGMVIVEAFAAGLPVVAARHGAMAELVADGRSGLLVAPGDPGELAAAVERLAASPAELSALRRNARAEFDEKYREARNHALLMRSYARARGVAAAPVTAAASELPMRQEENPWIP
jgi:glycosyltransferase involved in cell wall biosynthesis